MYPSSLLPTVVSEGLVGLRHAMRVFALPDGRAPVLGGIHQFVREAKRHGFFAAVTGGLDDPAHGQCLAARGANFNRYLVSSAAHATRFHLYHRFDVVERGGE